MRQTTTARTPTRATMRPAIGLIVATAGLIGTFVYQSTSSPASSFGVPPSPGARVVVPQPPASTAPTFVDVLRDNRGGATTEPDGAVTEDDGVLPDGVTVFDDKYPGVANLDSDLLGALRDAATDAADEGTEFSVNSGWRSTEYQAQLLREAVAQYGSEEEAARWVAPANASAHVSGDAVDIGPSAAMAWLSGQGATYGLCQTYRNEPWHFELRPEAIDRRCPRMYADSAHDPRMQE